MNRKNTLFIVSSGVDSDGYLNFINSSHVVQVVTHGVYLIFSTFNGYWAWCTFDTAENAQNALGIVLDQMDQAKANTPKKVIKINELDGVKGTDGVMMNDWNSTPAWTLP